MCYVLDEPTIGLHPRDNRILLDTLDGDATLITLGPLTNVAEALRADPELASRVPEFVAILNYDRIREYLATVPPPWVLKPRFSASAIGIRKLDRADQLWPTLDELGDRQSFHLLERFIPGNVYHVDSIVTDGDGVYACTSDAEVDWDRMEPDEKRLVAEASALDAATAAIGPQLSAGALVSYETTLPLGTTRERFAPTLAAGLGLATTACNPFASGDDRVDSRSIQIKNR